MIQTGTSGFKYDEWKGTFYPADLPSGKMLSFYAARFPSVEINYTFYRMPTEKLLSGWAAQVPPGFTFSLKAPRRMTHDRRLKDCADLVRGFCGACATLGDRLGVLLFQLAPNFKCDLDVFDAFLESFPPRVRVAFEFRHPSWLDEPVFDRLRARNFALCVADSPERHTPLVATAGYGYVRLRDEGYQDTDLTAWAGRVIEVAAWSDAFVYFKHEDEGRGAEFGQAFMRHLVSWNRDS